MELPEDILINIFSRLPEKSVGQCRCLSKAWRDNLSSPHFAKTHLNRKTHQQSLLLFHRSGSFHFITTTKDGAVSRELQWLRESHGILGCCDGLVLLETGEGSGTLRLVNPVTTKEVMIQTSPLALEYVKREILRIQGYGYDSSIVDFDIVIRYGVGYDSSIDDYKIVAVYHNYYGEECSTFVSVYSVKSGVWKMAGSESCPYYYYDFTGSCPGAFLNGAIHWLTKTREYQTVLVAFNLVDEAFTEIPTPGDDLVKLMVFEGCLCIIDLDDFALDTAHVWIMKEYGLVESWTKLGIHTCGRYRGITKPLCFVGDQEILVVVDGETLGVYNQRVGTFRDTIVDGVPFHDAIAFVPSLVSPPVPPPNAVMVFLLDVLSLEASVDTLAMALDYRSVLVQQLEPWSTRLDNLKRSVDLEVLDADISRFLKKLVKVSQMSPEGVKAFKALSKLEVDLYENVVRRCRRKLRKSGKIPEDVLMLIRPNVAEVGTPAEVAPDEGAGSSGFG